MSDHPDTPDIPTMTSETVGTDLGDGVRELAKYAEALAQDGIDPGYAMSSITWTALRIAERAQMYARAITADDDTEQTSFLSTIGAMFDDTGKLLHIDTDLDEFRYLTAAFTKDCGHSHTLRDLASE